jgi:GNAT superfamily N-acetyltransferase
VSIDIREAGTDDVETLFAIQRETSLAAFAEIFPPDRYPFPDDAVRARWSEAVADPGRRVRLAELDGRAAGMVAFRPGNLDALYVRPEAWRQGIGSRLHDEAIAGLRTTSSEVRLWVLEHNPVARRFYERHGWRLDGRERVVPFPPHPLDVGYTLALR